MPKTEMDLRSELICTRVTSAIKEAVIEEAQLEGLTPSEWLRNLIVKELKQRGALQRTYKFPDIEPNDQ
ncbi:MAG: hypothetical protein RMJ07_03450 [Nitrososphaerota archaeon]|nr:hypothetical protein [Candidatus Bathyarchaeota archaeon]MDW8048718.1 hypothetical protein [Nitrososphaerota archaeon]